jgi:DNA (cytosine-5)-methyltransferase 1
MIYGSVCSGIEAATLAWQGLGWKPAFFSEIEEFPRAVLQHHYPDVPLHGDFTTIKGEDYGSIDLLVGGTPCQSFSIAGLRGGLDDNRGNLALHYFKLVDQKRPRWVVWENVPGVLSSNGGRDFGSILGALAQLGYGYAYRVLDAQHFGVPQRRRRVFVVGYRGDWRRAGAVLFERESLRGNSSTRKKAQQNIAERNANSVKKCVNKFYKCVDRFDYVETNILGTVTANESQTFHDLILTKKGLNKFYRFMDYSTYIEDDTASCVKAHASKGYSDLIQNENRVRRLMPIECERLQGFPDDFTKIPYKGKNAENCPDTPRYKAIGNSMAVPVMKWIGERIQMVDGIN